MAFTLPLTRRTTALRPNNRVMPNMLRNRLGSKLDTTGSAVLNDRSNAEYLVSVSIGTPAQNFTVVVDTGSADLWVPTTTATSATNPDKLNTAASSTYKAGTQPFSIQYGEGDGVSGTYASDTVTVGGVTVQNQNFGAVTNGEKFFSDNNDNLLDGIIGLGYPGLSVGKFSTFVFTAQTQGLISDALLGIYLGPENGTTNGGSLTFGGVDNSHIQGELQYVDVQTDSQGGSYDFWWVNLNDVTIDGTSVAQSVAGTTQAILDTGTSLVYLQDQIVQAYYKNVPGAKQNSDGTFTVDQSYATSNHKLVFTFDNGIAITINASDLVVDDGNGTYIGGIVSNGDNTSTQILGDTFLRSAYVAYNGTTNQVGFAQSQ